VAGAVAARAEILGHARSDLTGHLAAKQAFTEIDRPQKRVECGLPKM